MGIKEYSLHNLFLCCMSYYFFVNRKTIVTGSHLQLYAYVGYIPVVADLRHRDGGSGAPTTEERQVCSVAGSPSINELFIESI